MHVDACSVARLVPRGALLSFLLLTSCTSSPAPLCSEAELRAALTDSVIGQVVRVGECRVPIAATLVVPAGVRLEGAGASSVLVSSGDTAVGADLLSLVPGDGDTTLANLAVEYSGSGVAVHAPQQVGVVSRALTLDTVTVTATRGIGIAVRDRQPLTISHVTLEGPVTAASAASLAAEPSASETATIGIALVGVGTATVPATITHLDVSGFATRGAAYVDGIIRWDVGTVTGNAGVGVLIQGGNVAMNSVVVDGTLALAGGLVPGISVAVSGAAEVTGDGLELGNATGYGLVLFDATATLQNLSSHDHSLAGVWSQGSIGLSLTGATTAVSRNGGAGIAALGTGRVAIEGARIEDTRAIPRAVGGTVEMVGDGLHVASGTSIDHVDGIVLAGNARVGMLLDAGGGTLSGSLTNITVSGTGTALGAIAQDGTIPSTWDDGISRAGDVVANDAAFTGTLSVLGDRLDPPALAAVDGI